MTFLASEAEIAAWKHAAWESQLSFSAWARNLLNGVTVFDPPEPDPVVFTAKKAKPANGKCVKRLPKDTFCKTCGSVH